MFGHSFVFFSGLFWSCWLSRIVLFRQRRQPQGPNSYFKDHRRWSLYKYWIAGLCATHPQESHFNHSHTPVSGWRSNWCNIFQLLSMWLWSDFRAELWFHALSLRDGINWYFNSAKCGSSNMSGLCVHHETPTGCTYLYFRNYMPRNESGTEIYFSTFISTFDFFWRTTKIRLTDRMLRLFSNSNFSDSSDWKLKLCVLSVTLMKRSVTATVHPAVLRHTTV